MTAQVRAVAGQAYLALAASIGVDAERELQRVGLTLGSMGDPHALIPLAAYARLLENTAASGHCPDFGLRLARAPQGGTLGPLAVLMRHSATVGQAIGRARDYAFLYSPSYKLAMQPVAGAGDLVDLVLDMGLAPVRQCTQAHEHGLGMMANILRLLGGPGLQPRQASLPHARCAPLAAYTKTFGCECLFEQPTAALRLRTGDLARRLPDHDPQLVELALRYLDQHFGPREAPFTGQVRITLLQQLGRASVTQADIAGQMAMHPRTLQRRLAAEGQRFEDLIDKVRSDLLADLLGQPTAPALAEVARLLGYSNQAALTRSCRRWFDCTPTELRRHQRSMAVRDAGSANR